VVGETFGKGTEKRESPLRAKRGKSKAEEGEDLRLIAVSRGKVSGSTLEDGERYLWREKERERGKGS